MSSIRNFRNVTKASRLFNNFDKLTTRGRKSIRNKMCTLLCGTNFVLNIFHSNQYIASHVRERSRTEHGCLYEAIFEIVIFKRKSMWLENSHKNLQCQILWKSVQRVFNYFIRTDGRTYDFYQYTYLSLMIS